MTTYSCTVLHYIYILHETFAQIKPTLFQRDDCHTRNNEGWTGGGGGGTGVEGAESGVEGAESGVEGAGSGGRGGGKRG